MEIKVIRTKNEYYEALEYVEELLACDPDSESTEGEKIALLTALIEDYEKEYYPTPEIDPIDAILFRMDQQNLKPRDLIPYIGSKSRVSEILARKRPLTLDMIRALQKGLGIPASILVKEQEIVDDFDQELIDGPTLKIMLKRGYLGINKIESNLNALIEEFFKVIGNHREISLLLKKTYSIRSSRKMNKKALLAWCARVMNKARINELPKFNPSSLNSETLISIIKLSKEPNGPILAVNKLRELGIAVVIEQHLPQTYLDGASILINIDNPVIGLTNRYDRLDNFWFDLAHELSHIYLHLNQGFNLYFDDLDIKDLSDTREIEADKFAEELLIPSIKWKGSSAQILFTKEAAQDLADELGISVSIVAGRIRYEKKNYKQLSALVGSGEIKQIFNLQ